jgi:hypothetical protein
MNEFILCFIWAVLGFWTSWESNKFWRDKHNVLYPWLDIFWGMLGGVVGGSALLSMFPIRSDSSILSNPYLNRFSEEMLSRNRFYNAASFGFSILCAIVGALSLYSLCVWLSSKKNQKNYVFWFKWLVASIGSIVIAIYVVKAIQGNRHLLSLDYFPFSEYSGYSDKNSLLTVLSSFTLGIAQWSVLQTRVTLKAKTYILATSLSYIIASYISSNMILGAYPYVFCDLFVSLISFFTVRSFCFTNNIIGAFVFGSTVGFIQWLILRNSFARPRLIFFAHIIGWTLVNFLMSYTMTFALADMSSIIRGISVVGLTIGINSAISGGTLVWLFKYNKN